MLKSGLAMALAVGALPGASIGETAGTPTTTAAGGATGRSITPARVLGQQTQHIGMGTAVTYPTLRYHPAFGAEAFATLSLLHPGRRSEDFGMATSLYEISVASYLQTVIAVAGFLDRAAMHCAAIGTHPDGFVGARLFEDMAPFHFQIECVYHHSVWALEAVKSGVFAPPTLVGPIPFGELQAMVTQTETTLKAFTPDEVNGWAGKNLDFQIGPRRLAFTAENFFLSFSLPNFHFHAVTAYDILRMKGVPLGKRDYEGQLRTRA